MHGECDTSPDRVDSDCLQPYLLLLEAFDFRQETPHSACGRKGQDSPRPFDCGTDFLSPEWSMSPETPESDRLLDRKQTRLLL